tara:strand:+ start:3860 stop:4873 length:1014 start_codon:yes stop_codon:yes gene_type:complete
MSEAGIEQAGPRSMGDIQEVFAQVLTGPEELPGGDSSSEEQPSTDSSDVAQQQDPELADDSVVDEQPVDEPEGELSENDQPIYTIKADGEESQVSLNELVNGYQRGATYTQRQQELAEERKTLEEQLQNVPAQEAAMRQTYQQYQEVLQQLRGQMEAANAPANLDWNALERDDPVQWLKLKELERQRGAEIQAVQAEQGRIQQLTQQENDNRLHHHIAVERTKVLERIPEWSDGDTQANDQRRLMEYGQTEGYSPEELNQLYDARAVVILRKAMLYDELTTGDKITSAKSKIGSVSGGSKTIAVQTRSRKAKAARARLKATGKVDDAAAIFANILTE